MRRPTIGIIGNHHLINDEYPTHAGGTMNSEAIASVSGCVPLLIPADPRFVSVEGLLEVCDGFLLTGGRPNVHPEEYGEAARPRVEEAYRFFDDSLKDSEFLAGDSYSIADIVLLTTMDFSTFAGCPAPDNCAALTAWHKRVSERPSAAA